MSDCPSIDSLQHIPPPPTHTHTHSEHVEVTVNEDCEKIDEKSQESSNDEQYTNEGTFLSFVCSSVWKHL